MARKYLFKTTPTFRKALRKLDRPLKESVRSAFAIFKHDSFDPRLRTHKIHGLSRKLGCTIYSVCIESDLRVIFYIDGAVVVSLDIGDHSIYRN